MPHAHILSNSLVGSSSISNDKLSLDLQFASDKVLTARKGPTPAFIRASSATYIDSSGAIATAATNVARFDHDPVSLICKGLLIEEQRRNLVFPSNSLTTQTVTVTATAHTISFYGTGTIVLSGAYAATIVGSGAYPTRTTLTFTPTAGSLIITVTGTASYAQLEIGSFATSYIPTTSSALTRSADICSISGTDFSGFYNQSEYSMECKFDFISSSGFNAMLSMYDGTSSNETDLNASPSNVILRSIVSGSTVVNLNLTRPSSNTMHKIAGAFKASNYAVVLNGGTPATSSSGSNPVVNVFTIGNARSGSDILNGHIAYARFYKKRLANSRLQTITT